MMSIRRVYPVLTLVFLVAPAGTWAHEHRAGFALMPRLADRSDLKGVVMAFEKVFCHRHPTDQEQKEGTEGELFLPEDFCKRPSKYSLLAETSYVWGEHDGENLTQFTTMLGARISQTGVVPEGKPSAVRLFGQVLLGFMHQNDLGELSPSFVSSAGVGADFGRGGWALRLQVDLNYSTDAGWFPQYSAGVVYRFN